MKKPFFKTPSSLSTVQLIDDLEQRIREKNSDSVARLGAETKLDGGNFSTGLVLGMALGIAGMYLFGTEKGKKVVEQAKVWGKENEMMQDLMRFLEKE
ncbi:MAG: hypothetical protein UX04_C0002G0068 [Microgenomates group bacterium GW2011_GWF2_45_18]|nr:MAG: hypothetical protein UW18_C0001G0029 [Microgenomates group bacterium GW2011_GWF1_44_10]KKU01925.1 MAG: hypothetical protein UX04_C0002G0068 [Microgenomates group bacterium GW2011_GWF2_45_18]OGJ41337.1 MAG: hypothetical protein A2378_01190 [Candidatus Pacebacteria bacterium RIFOXYB1_FULL_44_10]HAU98760.1 hypothetical protein [Candidatus Paceibacterota bacterium]HAX01420.1 hypothetical protein [Candidatus Paceibacterota bacterium]